MAYYIGFDVGGTNIVCGLVNEQGKLVRSTKLPTDAKSGTAPVLDRMASMVDSLLSEENISRSQLVAVGVGTPGFINPIKGIVNLAGNLGWKDVPVAALLEDRLGVPCFIDNDVRMYVYGEAISGAGRDFDHVLGITLGTGLAAAMVNEQKLYYGGDYIAGELGHIRVDGVDFACGCGSIGCLETIASATGIARQAKLRIEAGEQSILKEWLESGKIHDIRSVDVSNAYDEEDALAIDIMNYTGDALGRGLSYAVTLFSPDCLVIGGGASLAGERLLAPMRKQLQSSLFVGYWEKLHILMAENNDFAGVIGSAENARKRLSEVS